MTTTARPQQGDWLLEQLPNVYLEDEFFCQFVRFFAALAEPTIDHADSLPYLPDAAVTPEPLVPYLASWIGVDFVDPSLPAARQRELVARLGEILRWRGTRRGLEELLQVLTEGEVIVEDTGGVFPRRAEPPPNPKIVRVRVAGAGTIPPAQLADLVGAEIPADCTLELWVDGTLVPPRPRRVREPT